ncbi:hypothetical protein BDK51DRAFT_28963, partial [Blyttiomyces helicus]
WTQEETDYLFSLCRQFDLRFPVIADRYEYPGSSRSMEDLKERYYSIGRRLLPVQSLRDEIPLRDVAPYTYDKAREVERKRNLEVLYNRTAEQIKEEEILYNELRRREMKEEKWARERDMLLRHLRNNEIPPPPPPPPAPAPMTAGAGPVPAGPDAAANKLKKRKSLTSKPSPEPSEALAGSATKKKKNLEKGGEREGERGGDKRRTASVEPSSGLRGVDTDDASSRRDKVPAGAYLRSSRLAVTAGKNSTSQKLIGVFDNLGIGARPKMPTAEVCAKWEELRQSVMMLLDLKRQSDRVEHEISVLSIRNKQIEEEATGGRRASVASSTGGSVSHRKRASASPALMGREPKRPREGMWERSERATAAGPSSLSVGRFGRTADQLPASGHLRAFFPRQENWPSSTQPKPPSRISIKPRTMTNAVTSTEVPLDALKWVLEPSSTTEANTFYVHTQSGYFVLLQ